jgi:gliding motility-associated protein GldL
MSVTAQLDNMLADAKIGPELIESLGAGLNNLKQSTDRLADMSDASVASTEYADTLKSATMNVSNLSDAYVKASESLNGIAGSSNDAATMGVEMERISKNLSDLNAVYELQLKSATQQVESSSKYFEGVDELLQSLSDSVSDAKRYKQNIGQLSENISALNTVYGNMLSAMKG